MRKHKVNSFEQSMGIASKREKIFDPLVSMTQKTLANGLENFLDLEIFAFAGPLLTDKTKFDRVIESA